MNKAGFRSLMIIGFLWISASGCVGSEEIPEPENLIPEDQYIDLMVEMQHIITYRDARPDSVSADSLKTILYDRYKVTEEQFLESHSYYQMHVDDQLQRVDKALKRLEREKLNIRDHIDSVRASQAPQDENIQEDSSSVND